MPSQLTAQHALLTYAAHVCHTNSCAGACSVMLVGWGGNNGTTVTGGILANKQ